MIGHTSNVIGRSRDRKRRRSPSTWAHDKYEESSGSSKRKIAKEYGVWKEVKDEKRRRHSHEDRARESYREDSRYSSREDYRESREDSRVRTHYREDYRDDRSRSHREDSEYRGSHREESDYRGSSYREDSEYRGSSYREDSEYRSSHREERDRGYRDSHKEDSRVKEESSSGDLREILKRRRNADQDSRTEEADYEEGELRPSGSKSKHKKKSKSDSKDSKKKKKSKNKNSEQSDHEEVNEVQDDFEIDSVGQIENGEETLQKMKSAIIGILDDEIFALNKKNKK